VILVVHPSIGVNSVKELIALAKGSPASSLTPRPASAARRTCPASCSCRTPDQAWHVPYQGSPQAATDLLAGRVQVMFSPRHRGDLTGEVRQLKVWPVRPAKRASILRTFRP